MMSSSARELVLETLLRSRVPVAIFSWRNEEGWPVEFASPNAEHVLGYRAADFMTGQVVYADIIHPDDLARVTDEVMRGGASGAHEFEHEDYRIIDPAGRVRWISDYTAVVRDDAGRITHYLGYILDNTVRHEALHTRDLAMRAAEASARAKTEFLARVSHELRTPLALILGPLDALLTGEFGPLPDRALRNLERVYRSAERLHTLVSDLLDLTKLEAGAERVASEPLDVASLLWALLDEVRPTADSRELELTLDIAPNVGRIAADRGRVERILLNLLGNALKFTPPGGTISVSARMQGESLTIEVADTGPGIAARDHERIFQRFEQADTSSTRPHEGTGLGLSISRALADLMGGALTVASELGEGSRFVLRLPRGAPERAGSEATARPDRLVTRPRRAPRRRAPADRARTTSAEAAQERRDRPRIVLAEDNPDMREFMSEILEDTYEVEAVADGVEAIAAVRRAPPAVVVSDVMMPGVDGLTVVRTLKADLALKSIPIVLVTARAGRDELVSGLEAGADDYIAKPFAAAELRARVRAAERLHDSHLRLEREHQALEQAHETLLATQQQLVQAGKLAALGTFTAGISHELNTPLATIVMNVQRLLRQSDARSPEHARLKTVERHALRCRDLTRALLDFSRRKPSSTDRVQLRPLIDGVVQLARSQERERIIVVETDPPTAPPPEIEISVQDMETVILNLLSNALDATTPDGRVWISTGVRAREGEPGVELVVTDEGEGIPDDIVSRVFDPFFTTKPPGQGTGLGLAMTQRIVRDAGGHIAVESAPERGTTLRVWLPVAGAEAPR